MKFIHMADLHIGKRVYEQSMLEDQQYILGQILELVRKEKPDGVLIAGDVYDKNVPLERAVTLFDDFMTKLYELHVSVFLISGNHDSPQRLGFGGRILSANRLYLAGEYSGATEPVVLEDTYGETAVYLLPFLKPSLMRAYAEDVGTYEEAVRVAVEAMDIKTDRRNILVAHQFVAGGGCEPETCDSESLSVGGLDRVDPAVFQAFDYTALGHLHQAQKAGGDTVRYAGSPLKYSFSEVCHHKSVTLVELRDKGDVRIRLLPLTPLHDMRELKGPIAELLKPENVRKGDTGDYIRAILTDEEELYAPMDEMRKVYPHTLRLDFENSRTAYSELTSPRLSDIEEKAPIELFRDFYQKQNHQELSGEQEELVTRLIEEGEGLR